MNGDVFAYSYRDPNLANTREMGKRHSLHSGVYVAIYIKGYI